jgi:hypothetical protein
MTKRLLCVALVLVASVALAESVFIPPTLEDSLAVRVVTSGAVAATSAGWTPKAPATGLRAAWYHDATTQYGYTKATGSAGTWADQTGNGYTLTGDSSAASPVAASDGVTWTTASGHLSLKNTSLAYSGSSLSVVIRAKFTDSTYGGMCVAWFTYSGAVYSLTTAGGNIAHGSAGYAPGAWHVFLFRVDGSEQTLWVDGVKKSTAAYGDVYHWSTWSIGANDYVGSPWYMDGPISGALLYGRALSDAECADSVNWF